MMNVEIIVTQFCRSDLQIAIQPTDIRELEFPLTTENVLLIQKFTINVDTKNTQLQQTSLEYILY